MKTWDDYLSDIRPYLPECPDLVIRGTVKDVAAEFCEETECWIESADLTVVPSEREIPFASLIVPTTVTIVHPVWLGNEDGEIEPRTPRWLDRNRPGWRYANGAPEFYTMPVRGTVMLLAPHPETSLTLQAEVAVKPSDLATEGPDDLYEDYRVPIQAGVIAVLADIPNKPWTNEKLVLRNTAAFEAGKARALIRSTRGNARAPLRVPMNYRL